MESIVHYFQAYNLDIISFLKAAGILVAAFLVTSLLGRVIFGKRSTLSSAVSSAIGILFIYVLTVLLGGAGEQFQQFLSPLPFIHISEDTLYLFSFQAEYTFICSQILSMVILSFLMNLADGWLPNGKSILSWFFFRCLGVILAMLLHLVVTGLFRTYLPEGLVTYAPTVLLAILVLMLLTGALRFLVGILLTSVSPLIAALYTFFFSNVVGKQISKAVLTTGLLTVLVLALQKIGVTAISIGSAALAAYLPFLIILILLWYLANKIL